MKIEINDKTNNITLISENKSEDKALTKWVRRSVTDHEYMDANVILAGSLSITDTKGLDIIDKEIN